MPRRRTPSSPKPRRGSISRDVQTIRRSLSAIARALGRLGPALDEALAARSPGPAPTRRRPTLSPARRRALAWQGQYMSQVRELAPGQKARVKALRAKKGVEAAIRFAKSLARR